jgi:hypothetical protein
MCKLSVECWKLKFKNMKETIQTKSSVWCFDVWFSVCLYIYIYIPLFQKFLISLCDCEVVCRWFVNSSNSISSSRVISRVRCIKETDVSRTISSLIIRGVVCYRSSLCLIYIAPHITSLMMSTEMVLETSVSFIHLMRLIVREDFIESCRRESVRS